MNSKETKKHILSRLLTLPSKVGSEGRYEFLAIDHIKGGGVKHRKKRKIANIANYIFSEKFPKNTFRVLCHNCNLALGFYKYCPHNKKYTL